MHDSWGQVKYTAPAHALICKRPATNAEDQVANKCMGELVPSGAHEGPHELLVPYIPLDPNFAGVFCRRIMFAYL